MKKILGLLIVLTLITAMFVSCSSDVNEGGESGICSISIDVDGASKNIMTTVNMNMATSGTDAFYWQYEAKKIDEYGKVGQTSGRVRMKESGKGLPDVLYDFSSGKWLFSMYAYLDENFQDQVYDGSKEIILSPEQENRISIPMKRSQIAGDFGTLYINSDNISIAVEAKSVYVNNVASDTNWQDEQADKKVFGKLSDYSFQVAFCDEDWEVQNTFISTTNMESYSTQCSLELEPGVYYVRTKIFQNEQNEAVTYISYNAVSIYSNCVTTLQDSTNGDGYDGINMKRVKEYKIEYYDCSTTSSNAPFSGVHQWIIIRGNDGEGDEHIKWWTSHEYGRSETLDEPTKEGLGFAGYYEEPNPGATAIPLTTIKSTVYKDIKLYAKWDTINYKTISWDENWPIKSTGIHTAYTNGSTSGGKDDVYTLRTAPVCQGYIFKGWYTESAPDILIVADSGFPKPTKHDQVVTYKAKWEPVKYSIKFNLNRANNGTDSTAFAATNPNADINNCIYDEVYEVKDAVSTVKGFMGWSTTSNWASGVDKLVGLDGTLKNLTEIDGTPVTLYAVWNDMYTPLEYIRSYPANTKNGPYIDTKVVPKVGMSAEMEMEWAGSTKTATSDYWEIPFGARQSGKNDFMMAGTNGRDIEANASGTYGTSRWVYFSDSAKLGGLPIYEDQKYKIKMTTANTDRAFYVDGERVIDRSGTTQTAPTINMFLFAGNSNGTATWCTDMRLFSCNVYDETGKIIRKFVPCTVKTAITASNKAKYASDGNTHAVGEAGLWDLVTNQFYPNKNTSYKFYVPNDERKITFKANGGVGADRVQRVLKTKDEFLHKNIFSKELCDFKGWITNTANKAADYIDKATLAASSSNLTLNALWSVPINYEMFDVVDYISSDGVAYIDSKIIPAAGVNYHIIFSSVDIGATYYGVMGSGNYYNSNDNLSLSLSMQGDNSGAGGRTCFLLYRASSENNINIGRCDGVATTGVGTVTTWTNDTFWYRDHKISVDMSTERYYFQDLNNGKFCRYNCKTVGFSLTPTRTLHVFQCNMDNKDIGIGKVGKLKVYGFDVSKNGVELNNLVPCVTKVPLTSSYSYKIAGSTASQAGNKFVSGEKNINAGVAGLWDITNNKFYPNAATSGKFNVPTEIRIRFNCNGGNGVMSDLVKASGTTQVTLPDCGFFRDGYEFIGWTDKPDKNASGVKWYSDKRTLHGTGEVKNMTLFAQWRQIPSTVCYEKLEKIWNDTDETHAYINTGFKPKKAQGRIVYTYGRTTANSYKDSMLGASGNSTGKTANGSLTVGDKTISVSDSAVGSIYSIDVYWNGSTERADISGVYSASDYAAKFADASGNMCLFADSATSVRSYGGNELYSMKIYDDKEMLVRDFVPCVLTRAITAAEDANSIARTKGTVGLWDKCTNKFYGNVDTTGGYFVTNNKVSIIFDGNGATSGKMDILTAEVGESITLTANAYSRSDGARFIGWNTEANGTGIWYSNKYETNTWTGGGHKLYAQWESRYGALDLDYFEPVNYVKSTGVQYIDTLWTHPANKNFKITLNANFLSGSGGYGVNGAGTNTTTKAAQFCIALGASGYNREWSQAVTNANLKVGTRHLYVLDPAGECVWIDGTKTTHTAKGIAAGMANHYLFAYAQPDGTPVYAEVEVYNYKVEEGSVVKKNFIPCRLMKNINMYYAGRLSADEKSHDAGVLGFWDTVENKFYGNVGTGTFVCEKN